MIVTVGLGLNAAAVNPWKGVEVTEGRMALMTLGGELDDLADRIEDNARRVAKVFLRYAEVVREGNVVDVPASSNVRDMERDKAAFVAKLDAFKAFFAIVTGKKFGVVVAEIKAVMDRHPELAHRNNGDL
ncbi:MAG: hypothetical protein WBY94_09810 [Polyangiaceae bacterium]